MSNYIYNIATDFHGIDPNLNKLSIDIKRSTISQEILAIDNDSINVTITFANALTTTEKTTLDNIVDTHTPDVPFPYSHITTSSTTNSTDTYQTINTVNFYAIQDNKYKVDIDFQFASTLTGMDVRVLLNGNVIYINNQLLNTLLLNTRINVCTFTVENIVVGYHTLQLQFRRPSVLASTTVYNSKLFASIVSV